MIDKTIQATKDWLWPLVVSGFAALAPIHTVLFVVGLLILIDTITGVWAAYKEGQKITSAKLRRLVSKIVIYNIAVISAFLLENWLLEGLLPVSKIVAGAVGSVEMKSILENGNRITGLDLFSEVIKRLGSKNDSDHPTDPPV